MFNGVCGPAEEMPPEGTMDELEEGENTVGTDRGASGFAVEEEGEKTQAQGVALFVESTRMVIELRFQTRERGFGGSHLRSRSCIPVTRF